MTAYYNEHDPKAAAWIRELINQGHIAPGVVDERSIEDVKPTELAGYTQCHFFAGIGVWSHSLRRAGWSDDRPVWTGSCPCQPFSAAGKGDGFADERHLWPAFHHLIEQCKPDVVFGEQVASKDGLAWIDLVLADLEGAGYTAGAVDTCSAGFGAPHIRQRLYWMADSDGTGCVEGRTRSEAARYGGSSFATCGTGRMGDNNNKGLEGLGSGHQAEGGRIGAVGSVAQAGESGGVGNSQYDGCTAPTLSGSNGTPIPDGAQGAQCAMQLEGTSQSVDVPEPPATAATRPTNGFWRDADWLFCRDGKWRPVRPGTFPLAHGAPARVGRLRGYGNAINAEAATAFIEAAM